MAIFSCSECAAKEAANKAQAEHVAFLQSLVRDLQGKLLEAVSPGGNARVAAAGRIAVPVVPREKKKPEPDLERQQMAPLPGHD